MKKNSRFIKFRLLFIFEIILIITISSASASTLFEYWFDEELGNKIIDYSGNNYNSSIYNSSIRGYVSNSGLRGVTFNNGKTNEYAMTLHNNDFNVSDLTIETYQIVSSSQIAGFNRYIDKTDSYVFSMNISRRALYLNNGSVESYTNNNVASFDKLEFVAVSYNRSSCNAKFYVNGALVQTVNKCIILKNSSGNIYISNNKDLTRPSNGSVFWLKLSNTVLSDDQILNDYVNVSLMNNYMNISKRQTDLVFKGNLGRGWFSTNSTAIKADGSSIVITDSKTGEGPAIRVNYTYWGDEYWINSTVSITSGHYAMLLFRNTTNSKYIQVSLNWNSSGKRDYAIGLNKNGVWSENGYYPRGFTFPTKVNWRILSNGSTEVYFNDKLYLSNHTQWIDLSNYDHFELISGATTTGVYKIYNVSTVNFFLVPQKKDAYPHYVTNTDTDGYNWVYTTAAGGWTQGFYPAGLWWSVSKHNTTRNKKIAEAWTDKYLSEFVFQDTHDQGFLALPFTEGIKHNNKSVWYNKAMDMANRLVNYQYNNTIKAIPTIHGGKTVIIDSTMNLMLLDWAYSKTGNKTYLNVMKNSTSTLIKNHVKNSGAFWQDVDFNSIGTAIRWYNTQAVSNETWARGNGWGIYGLTHMFTTTPTDINKNAIINVSNYLVTKASTFSDYVFYNTIENSTSSQDTSGASLIAAGLYKAYTITGNATYKNTADKIRTNLSKKYLKNDGRLVNGSYRESERKRELIFGDYYMGLLLDEIYPQPPVSTTSFMVISPNGGENWARGTTQMIRWNYTGSPGSYVKIELMKNGVLNRVINSNTPVGSSGSGSYIWLINSTQTLGSDYNVRVTSTTNSIYTDTSNNNFTISIQTSVNLIKNPGFESGTASWIFYTNGNGIFTAASPGYEGTKAAKLVLNAKGTNVQLYQTGITLEPNTRYRLSFAAYSKSGNDLTVRLIKHVSPYNPYMPDFKADLSMNWKTFTTEFTTENFMGTMKDGRLMFWLAPFAATGDTYYIDNVRLEMDQIAPPGITVISPNGGENWARGTTQTIRWNYTGSPGSYVKIELMKNGVLNRVINLSTPVGSSGSGSYIWLINSTQTLGSDYNVRVTSTTNSVYTDTSNNNFTISIQTSVNLIKNPGFESGTASWIFYTNGNGIFTAASPGYEGTKAAKLVLNTKGTNVQLYQTGITLEPNTRYRLSFAAYSKSGNDLTVRLIKHVSPYNPYMPDFKADLSMNWKTFTTEFTTENFMGTMKDGRLMFWLAPFAATGDTYYIDNVRLEK